MIGCAEVGPSNLNYLGYSGYNRIWAAELAVIKISTLRKHRYFDNGNTNSKQLYYKIVGKSSNLKFLTKTLVVKAMCGELEGLEIQ